MAIKHDYIAVAPVTSKGKWTICSRRIGKQDRFAQVAVATTEQQATAIVDALNLLQGKMREIDTPAQLEIARLKADLQGAHSSSKRAQSEASHLREQLRAAQRDLDNRTHERNMAQAKLKIAEEKMAAAPVVGGKLSHVDRHNVEHWRLWAKKPTNNHLNHANEALLQLIKIIDVLAPEEKVPA